MKQLTIQFLIVLLILGSIIGISYYVTKDYWQTSSVDVSAPFTMSGVVIAIDEGKFLVVNGIGLDEMENLSLEEIVDLSREAAWFSTDEATISTITLLECVSVTYTNMDESFPGQGKADQVRGCDHAD